MKKLAYTFVFLPIFYSLFMIYKTPNIADAIIVLSLACLSFGLIFIHFKKEQIKVIPEEIQNKSYELELEKLVLSIEQLKENAAKQKAMRDAKAAIGDMPNKFKF